MSQSLVYQSGPSTSQDSLKVPESCRSVPGYRLTLLPSFVDAKHGSLFKEKEGFTFPELSMRDCGNWGAPNKVL